MKKAISLFLLFTCLLFSLTGCYDAKPLETLSYVVAIGLDKGTHNLLRLSLQFASPNGSSAGGNSSQFSGTTVTTVECNSIESGINLINSYISNQINLSHAKVIVMSEALSVEGVAEYISTFINNIEVRPDCDIIISRCSAEDFLNNSQPTLETLSARFYEQIVTSSQYTGFTDNISLSDFYSAYQSNVCQAVAILGGVNTTNRDNNVIDPTIPYVEIDSSYKAGQTPIQDKTNLEYIGLAVFRDDKLVGELDGFETMCHLICSNKFGSSVISIPSPFEENGIIDLSISKNSATKREVELVNGSPYITCDISLNATVLSMGNEIDVSTNENIAIISEYANSYLEEKILDYLYKTAKQLHADIDCFGKHLYADYLTIEEFEKIGWLEIYQDSYFDVHVDVTVKSSNLLIKD